MNFLKKYWHLLLLLIISLAVFSYKLSPATSFEGDLGRDLFEIARISFGKLTLLGPKGSFGGIYTAPYHYYLFLLPFMIAGRQLNGILYFNVIIFSLSVVFFGYRAGKKYGTLTGFMSGLIFIMLPFFIFAARNPGNGYTPAALFLVFLTIVHFYDLNKFDNVKTSFLGLLFGIIISMLFAYVIIFLPVLFIVFFLIKDKRKFALFIAGFVFAFSPLVLFELKNHFVMLKNTFIDKSYLSFMNNTNLPGAVKLNKNIFMNSLDLINKMQAFIGMNVYLIFIFLAASLIWINKLKDRLLIYATGMAFVVLAFLLRFQYSDHYLLPFLVLLSFCLLLVIAETKLNKLTYIVLVLLTVLSFPKNYYLKAQRNYQLIKSRVEKTLSKNYISKQDKFNVILKRSDDAPTPAGNEYRFFLLINGYNPISEFLYKDSNKLLIFNEGGKVDFKKFDTWEISQFNYSSVKTVKSFKTDPGMTVYLLEK